MKQKMKILLIVSVLIVGSVLIAGCVGREPPVDIEPTIEKPVDNVIGTIPTEIIPEKTEEKKIDNIEKTEYNVPIAIYTTYQKFDKYYGVHMLSVNISSKESGRFIYLENYYSLDSQGKHKFYSNEKLYDGNISVDEILNINVQRPRDRRGIAYSLIEKIFILNGNKKIIWVDLQEYWQ